jgi:acyl-CoA hydrolase
VPRIKATTRVIESTGEPPKWCSVLVQQTGEPHRDDRGACRRALANVERAGHIARGRIAIKRNGGISSGADVIAMLRATVTCVDLYSAFIYRGWSVARKINQEILEIRMDIFADGRPRGSQQVVDGKSRIGMDATVNAGSTIDIQGYSQGQLAAARRLAP